MKNSKDLPLANIFLRKFEEKDSDFSTLNYLEDSEKYFEKIKKWKNDFEKDYLERYPHLRLEPIRQKKIYRHQKVVF